MSEEEIKEDINEVFDIYIQNQQLKNKLREAVNINISLQNQLQQKENIIKEVRNWVNSTIDIIKQQPTGNDEWILGRLNSFISLLDKGE